VTTMYHEIDMRFWLEKAEAELEGVSELTRSANRISIHARRDPMKNVQMAVEGNIRPRLLGHDQNRR
jgi:hypothetical protein